MANQPHSISKIYKKELHAQNDFFKMLPRIRLQNCRDERAYGRLGGCLGKKREDFFHGVNYFGAGSQITMKNHLTVLSIWHLELRRPAMHALIKFWPALFDPAERQDGVKRHPLVEGILEILLDKLEQETVKWCREILKNSPTAVRVLKSALNAVDDGHAGLQELAGNTTLIFYGTEEANEGRQAFMQRRRPDFSKFPRAP